MRKSQLVLFALIMLNFGCESSPEASPALDLDQVSKQYYDMFQGAFGMTDTLAIASVVEKSSKQVFIKIEVEEISKSTDLYFANLFNTAAKLDRIIYPAPTVSTISNEIRSKKMNRIIDSSTALNVLQKSYIKSLSKDMVEVESHAEANKLLSAFKGLIINASDLNEGEKLLLLEIAAGSKVLLEFIENGGVEEVRNKLILSITNNINIGKMAVCSVDWRGVWIDGVLSLIGGAVVGGLTGALVGSYTVPFLGTVVGGVNGAVIGGAVGFTGGVLYGIAGDLITSCSRTANSTLQQTFTSCEDAWQAFMLGEITSMPSDCFIVEVPI
jgi:uncharacterized membrane protein